MRNIYLRLLIEKLNTENQIKKTGYTQYPLKINSMNKLGLLLIPFLMIVHSYLHFVTNRVIERKNIVNILKWNHMN